MRHILASITSSAAPGRDLLIDDLGDIILDGGADLSEIEFVIRGLIDQAKNENEESVLESIYNLFRNAYFHGFLANEIAQATVAEVDRLPFGALIHAIDIVANSDLPFKRQVLERFLDSDNEEIRSAVVDCLSEL